jgi:hypothetical protein
VISEWFRSYVSKVNAIPQIARDRRGPLSTYMKQSEITISYRILLDIGVLALSIWLSSSISLPAPFRCGCHSLVPRSISSKLMKNKTAERTTSLVTESDSGHSSVVLRWRIARCFALSASDKVVVASWGSPRTGKCTKRISDTEKSESLVDGASVNRDRWVILKRWRAEFATSICKINGCARARGIS